MTKKRKLRNPTPFWKKTYFNTIAQWTAPWRKLPEFVIIGAQKGGTSSLFKYLEPHPDLLMSYRKQVHFFDKLYHRGVKYYRSNFPIKAFSRGRLTGEATPYYIFHPEVPARIHKVLPNAKLILLVRNPIDRAYSHYNMKVNQGWESIPTFDEAIEKEGERIERELAKMKENPRYYSKDLRNFTYLARGRYAEQLERWLQYYPLEQIRVYQSEQFFEDPMAVLRDIYDFLGIQDFEPQNLKIYNKRHYEPMPPAMRAHLRAYYQPHNERFYELIGKRFDWDEPIPVGEANH